jgi:hypothetical protein
MILRPRKPGVVRVKVETLHWITGKVLGSAETLITVSGQAIPDPPKPPSNPYPPGPASPYPSAPAAQPPAPAPAATPSQPLKASVKGKKVVSKAKRKPKKLSLRERLRRRKRLQAKAKAKAKAKGTATRKPGAKKASPAKRSSRKR